MHNTLCICIHDSKRAFNDLHTGTRALLLQLIIPLQSKYKLASKKERQSGSFTTLPETRDTAHSKVVTKITSSVSASLQYVHTDRI